MLVSGLAEGKDEYVCLSVKFLEHRAASQRGPVQVRPQLALEEACMSNRELCIRSAVMRVEISLCWH